MINFSQAVNNFVVNTDELVKDKVEDKVITLFSKIVSLTPVDSGLLRGSWIANIGSRYSGIPTVTDSSGSRTVSNIKKIVKKWDGKSSLFLTNNQPYAIPIEYGHSKTKAPSGMVRVAILDAVI